MVCLVTLEEFDNRVAVLGDSAGKTDVLLRLLSLVSPALADIGIGQRLADNTVLKEGGFIAHTLV